MKRILLICCLLTATITSIPSHITAQTVTTSSFMSKVNNMDAYIGAGNITAARSTWNSIHVDLLSVLAVTQKSIRVATSPTDKTYYTNIMTGQRTLYDRIMANHSDLLSNRTTLYTDLSSFDLTIY